MEEMVTTTTRRNALLEMFLDGTAGEAYADGRLKTESTENGVQLVAYHEHVLAFISDDAGEVTLFTGHHNAHSETVTRYMSELGRLLSNRENREVTVLDGHAPTTGYGRVAAAGQYIDNYVGGFTDMSPVERSAHQEVNEALRARL